jgi:hypothetical protein
MLDILPLRHEHEEPDEVEIYCQPLVLLKDGLQVYRSLCEDQARDIRVGLWEEGRKIPGMQIRGYGDSKEPRLSIMEAGESKKVPGIELLDESQTIDMIYKGVTSLRRRQRIPVKNIGTFGFRGTSKKSIAVALCDDPVSVTVGEREGVKSVLLQETQADDDDFRRFWRPHVTVAIIPANTPPETERRLKHTVSELVPDELHFDWATIKS